METWFPSRSAERLCVGGVSACDDVSDSENAALATTVVRLLLVVHNIAKKSPFTLVEHFESGSTGNAAGVTAEAFNTVAETPACRTEILIDYSGPARSADNLCLG